MKNSPHRTAWLVATAALCGLGTGPQLDAGVVSDPVTASKWTVPAGPALISAPAKGGLVYSGTVSSVAGNVITLSGVSLTPGALMQLDPSGGGGAPDMPQYMIILRHDKTGDGKKNQGDWWGISDNTASTVTVIPDLFGNADTRVASGDVMEIYQLLSLRDIFGTGASALLDPNPDITGTTGDRINTLVGTSFADTIIWHDGSVTGVAEYTLNAAYQLGDGSLYTFPPDQATLVFNDVGAAFDLTLTGILQTFSLSHYLAVGFNPFSTGYAVTVPIGEAGLLSPPFAPDPDYALAGDTIYMLVGTAFGDFLKYNNGSTSNPAGWVVNNAAYDDTYPLAAGAGFLLDSATSYVWRQPDPLD